jgi:BMFP domain-containing protein YqiC
MTTPRQPPSGQIGPTRRRPASESFSDSEVARGQSDAILGALGRMQLRLDLLAREQSEAFEQVLARLERLEARLDEFEVSYDAPATAAAPEPSATAAADPYFQTRT